MDFLSVKDTIESGLVHATRRTRLCVFSVAVSLSVDRKLEKRKVTAWQPKFVLGQRHAPFPKKRDLLDASDDRHCQGLREVQVSRLQILLIERTQFLALRMIGTHVGLTTSGLPARPSNLISWSRERPLHSGRHRSAETWQSTAHRALLHGKVRTLMMSCTKLLYGLLDHGPT